MQKKTMGQPMARSFCVVLTIPWEGVATLTHGLFQTLTKRCRGQAYVIARHHQLSKYLLLTKIINKTLPTWSVYI
jgi:hypothetical protein